MQNSIIETLSRIEGLLTAHPFKPLPFREAFKYLGVSPSFLYKLTSKGLIRHYKPSGKLIFFNAKDLDNWLLKNPVKSFDEINEEVATRLTLKKNHLIKGGYHE